MNTYKQAGLWETVKRLWRKWTGGSEYPGPTRTEDQVVDAFAEDFVENGLWTMKPLILRQFVEEANKAGLPSKYLSYVAWLWNTRPGSWPQMSPTSFVGLQVARDLLGTDMPNYHTSMVMPPVDMEAAVDQMLKSFGFWSSTKMLAQILRFYAAMIAKWTPAMERAVGDTLPKGKSGVYLRVLFEDSLRRSSAQFLDGPILDDIFFGLMK